MTRPRYGKRSSLADELTISQKLHITKGWPLLPDTGFPDRESFEEAWEIHREALIEEFCEESPNAMPFAWWLLDHCKERPVVGSGINEARMRAHQHRNNPEMFGFLHTSIVAFGGPWQQTEESYLKEHGLI